MKATDKEPSPPANAANEAVIDRFEGETAVLVFQDGSVAYVPRRCLPEDAEPGQTLIVKIEVSRSNQ